MLDEAYLLRISEGAEEIAGELHEEIVRRIIERMMARIGRGEEYLLTAADKWQLETLQEAGYLLEDIQREIAAKTKLEQTEIADAMRDAGVRAIKYDDAIYRAAGLSPTALEQSPHLTRLLQRGYEATMGEWHNLTRTTANAAQQAFIRACDKAYNLTASGAVSYTEAVRQAINDIADKGVYVDYPSGHTDTIETATLRAVRTGVGQASAQITTARMEEMDWDIVLVSSHMGARPGDGGENPTNHAWWQGKFYSRTGRDTRFSPLSVTGYGTGEGLCGWNCRHSFGPGDGEHNPYTQYDTDENRKEYDLQQRQRQLERRIRDTKRSVMGKKAAVDNCKDDALREKAERDYQRKAALLAKRNKAYNDFCAQNDLKRLQDRLTVAKWDRQQAAAASGAARKYENRVKK